MFRKTFHQSSIVQSDVSRPKDSDIIKLYERQLKESTDKQRRILEIQRRAVRKPRSSLEEEEQKRVLPRRRVSNRFTFLPAIRNQNSVYKDQAIKNKNEEDKVGQGNENASQMRLPNIASSKPSKGKSRKLYGERSDRGPVFDPRFRGLLSSLIAIPEQYGQIQRYAPPKRLSFVSIKD